jgi:hypothetical protein
LLQHHQTRLLTIQIEGQNRLAVPLLAGTVVSTAERIAWWW